MTYETLKSRIDNATATIEKKNATIDRKLEQCRKHVELIRAEFAEYEYGRQYGTAEHPEITWEAEKAMNYTVPTLLQDVQRATKQIAELEKKLEGYRNQMAELETKEAEIPMDLVEEIENKLNKFEPERAEQNKKTAKYLVEDLVNRCKEKVGTVTDWRNVHPTLGNHGCTLNGFVIGTNGRAEVESVLAGGYNIQRLHIRTLVK